MTLKVNYGYFSGVGGIAGNELLGEVAEGLDFSVAAIALNCG